MVRVKKGKTKCLFCIGVGIILGILIGSVAINVLVSYRIDQYHEEIRYLKNTIEDKDVKLKKLEESINKTRLILKDINIILVYDGDEIDKMTIEKTIREKYTNLLGKEVEDIDIDMVGEVVDKRIMKIDNKEYQLSVTKIILTDILRIWIQTDLIEAGTSE